jgi:hypothetical protein
MTVMDAGMHAERALLGAVLVDGDGQQPVVSLLSPEDFTGLGTGKCWPRCSDWLRAVVLPGRKRSMPS